MGIYQQEHLIFQQSVRKFASEHLFPHITEWEEQKNFPDTVFSKLGEQGFLGILIPEEFGGVAGDYVLAGAWCEEFGRVPSVGLTVAVNMHSLVILPALCRYGQQSEKAKWAQAAVEGKAIGAYAFTEPGAGSDLTVLQTRARRDGSDYILNGSKIFITNGDRADFILVLAKTDPDQGMDGYTTFVVDTGLAGFSVSRKLSKIGWHCSDTTELTFENVRLPASAVLGEVGKGWHQAMASLEWERVMLALTSLGGATACLEATIRYVGERKVFGKTVGEFDNTRELIASLWSRLESARALCHRTLHCLARGIRPRVEASLAKLFVCELAIEVADRCLQLHGGYGYTTEFLPERWLRDLRLNTIGGGTSEVMCHIASKELLRPAKT